MSLLFGSIGFKTAVGWKVRELHREENEAIPDVRLSVLVQMCNEAAVCMEHSPCNGTARRFPCLSRQTVNDVCCGVPFSGFVLYQYWANRFFAGEMRYSPAGYSFRSRHHSFRSRHHSFRPRRHSLTVANSNPYETQLFQLWASLRNRAYVRLGDARPLVQAEQL